MAYIALYEANLTMIKRGKISAHKSKAKGRQYIKGKIYLTNGGEIGYNYQLYEIENMHLINSHKQHKTGKAYIVFIQN